MFTISCAAYFKYSLCEILNFLMKYGSFHDENYSGNISKYIYIYIYPFSYILSTEILIIVFVHHKVEDKTVSRVCLTIQFTSSFLSSFLELHHVVLQSFNLCLKSGTIFRLLEITADDILSLILMQISSAFFRLN